MAGSEDRTYTEAEHVALTADAVQRENASLTSVKVELESKNSELTGKVEVLEAEKATLATQVAEAEKALADFKAEVERATQVEALKSERAAAVKAAAPALPETHFTDERILAWAELSAETFDIVVDGLKATAGTPVVARESAAFKGGAAAGTTGTDGAATEHVTGRFLSVGRES